MTNQEAMKLALEALKQDVRMAGGWTSSGEYKAIKALEEALASEQEQRSVRALADSEQLGEPVAWIRKTDITEITVCEPEEDSYAPLYTTPQPKQEQDGSLINEGTKSKQEQGALVALETVYETIIHWDEGGGKRSRRELARRIEALYTTSQQRTWVGLTDDDKVLIKHDANYNQFMTAGEYADRVQQLTEARIKDKNNA